MISANLSKTEERLIAYSKTVVGDIPQIARNVDRKLRLLQLLRRAGVDCDSKEFGEKVGELSGHKDLYRRMNQLREGVEMKWDSISRICDHYGLNIQDVCTPEDNPDVVPKTFDQPPGPTLLPETQALISVIDKALRGMDLIDRCKAVSRITDILNMKGGKERVKNQKPFHLKPHDEPADCLLPLTPGQRIKALRVLNGFTQESLCEADKNINRASLSNWEKGNWKPRMESVVSLGNILGCDPGLIMFGEGALSSCNWQMLLPRKSDGWRGLAGLLVAFLKERGFTHVNQNDNVFIFFGENVEDAILVAPGKIAGMFDRDVAMKFLERI